MVPAYLLGQSSQLRDLDTQPLLDRHPVASHALKLARLGLGPQLFQNFFYGRHGQLLPGTDWLIYATAIPVRPQPLAPS